MKIPRRFTGYLLQQVGLQGLLVLAIVVFGFLLFDDVFYRWDLTEDNRFTISKASHRMAAALEDPLTIRAYMSGNLPPRYEPLQRQVLDVLAEYEAASGGKIKVERYDPNESRTAENEAKDYGIRPVQLQVYEATEVQVLQVYGGIVLVYRDRASEVINFAERFPQGYEGLSVLEYEISSKLWQLSHERSKVGLTGYLEGAPQGNPMMPNQGAPRPEFQGLRRLIGEDFEIENVDLKKEAIDPGEIPLLIVVRPREFSDVEVFRLDQYLLKGGRVLLFVSQGTIGQSPWNRQWTYSAFKTGLDAWFEHHGLRVPNEFVLHGANAWTVQVPIGQAGNGITLVAPVPNWFWPRISAEDAIDKNNPAVQTLDEITMLWAHPVDLLEDRVAEGVTATVLVKSHARESWRWKDHSRVGMEAMDLEGGSDNPDRSDLRASPLAVALEGTFRSYYADNPVPPSLTEEVEDEKGEKQTKAPDVVKDSANPGHLIVIGNAVFVSDIVLGGQQVGDRQKQAALLAFNLVDWLARSADLINLRAKRFSDRALVDKDFDSDMEAIGEEVTREEFRTKWDEARERQKLRRKRWRWINIIIPCFVVLVAGAVVWIVRAARRSNRPKIPAAMPPASAGAQGGDG